MHVLKTVDYRKLVGLLANVAECPFTGTAEDQVKLILGEIGDIWPAVIFDGIIGDEDASAPCNTAA
jgi:hypothetical protein